jgi:hypothetical protein
MYTLKTAKNRLSHRGYEEMLINDINNKPRGLFFLLTLFGTYRRYSAVCMNIQLK